MFLGHFSVLVFVITARISLSVSRVPTRGFSISFRNATAAAARSVPGLDPALPVTPLLPLSPFSVLRELALCLAVQGGASAACAAPAAAAAAAVAAPHGLAASTAPLSEIAVFESGRALLRRRGFDFLAHTSRQRGAVITGLPSASSTPTATAAAAAAVTTHARGERAGEVMRRKETCEKNAAQD